MTVHSQCRKRTLTVTSPSSPLAGRRVVTGYTQEHLADVLGVDRTTVARWERGVQVPRPWQRPDLAQRLQITLDQLDDLLRTSRCSGTDQDGHRPP